jgi:protoheme IX farnesyltransferase
MNFSDDLNYLKRGMTNMAKDNPSKLALFLALIKFRVSLPVTYLCFAGYYLFDGKFSVNMVLACLGVFLLSSSSSVWNQIIERKYDFLMDRTQSRPLPSGKMKVWQAVLIGSSLLLIGGGALLIVSLPSFVLGFFAVAWYIFIYTFLKRKTAFATIPGALVGAIPLLIGWSAAGGGVFEKYIVILSVFVFIWQIPHFWLIMMVYNKDYQKAGFPTFVTTFSEKNFKIWTLAWILDLTIMACLLPLFLHISNPFIKLIFAGLSVLVIVFSTKILMFEREKERNSHMRLFHILNSFMVLVLLILLFV